MTPAELINLLSILFVMVGTALGWRVIIQEGRKKKLEGDEVASAARKVEAEAVNTMITSSGQVIETYKQILIKLEAKLTECEDEHEEDEIAMTKTLVEKRKLELELENCRGNRQRLLDKIIELEAALKSKEQVKNGT